MSKDEIQTLTEKRVFESVGDSPVYVFGKKNDNLDKTKIYVISNKKDDDLNENNSLGKAFYDEVQWNLLIGKYPFLETYPLIRNCGNNKITIFLDFEDKSLICIGEFKGTKEDAIKRIKKKYKGEAQKEYIKKIKDCFALNKIPKEIK